MPGELEQSVGPSQVDPLEMDQHLTVQMNEFRFGVKSHHSPRFDVYNLHEEYT